jgi:hypothetical protein
MGGVSYSNWTVDDEYEKGIWRGEVKVVPSLDAPGFCTVASQVKPWPDAAGYSHMLIRARSIIPYQGFKVSLGNSSSFPVSLLVTECHYENAKL